MIEKGIEQNGEVKDKVTKTGKCMFDIKLYGRIKKFLDNFL